MRKALSTTLLGALALLAAPQCAAQPAPSPAPRELAYGSDPLQRLDFWRAAGGTPAPLVVFIHGGGWSSGDKDSETGSAKLAHFLGKGYAFASLNYRLVPDVPVERQVQDAADAVAWLAGQGAELGIDPNRIILMGHSSGGHLAALIGADPRFLGNAKAPIAMPAAVVLLDGAGLVPRTGGQGQRRGPFATDAERQALAPVNHVAAPNAPAFLMLNAASQDLRDQAAALGSALEANGAVVRRQTIEGADHMSLSENLGLETDAATRAVDAFLAELPAR